MWKLLLFHTMGIDGHKANRGTFKLSLHHLPTYESANTIQKSIWSPDVNCQSVLKLKWLFLCTLSNRVVQPIPAPFVSCAFPPGWCVYFKIVLIVYPSHSAGMAVCSCSFSSPQNKAGIHNYTILRKCLVGVLASSNTGGKMAQEPPTVNSIHQQWNIWQYLKR